jgi:hypothetical protein
MSSFLTSPLLDDLRRRLGDVTRIPAADRRAAVAELERIEAELSRRTVPADAEGSRVAALAVEAQFVLAGFVPSFGQGLFAVERGSPADHPPLADVLAALGFIKNALVKSLPAGDGRGATPSTARPQPARPESRNDR